MTIVASASSRRLAAPLALLVIAGLSACSGGSADETVGPAGAAAVTGEASAPSLGAEYSWDEDPATDAPRPTTTDVVFSYARWDEARATLEVGGYVSPVIESGGTCSVDLEQSGRTVSVTAAAVADATTTICGGLSVPGDRLSGGTWTLVLHYTSPSTEGTSEPMSVEVPS